MTDLAAALDRLIDVCWRMDVENPGDRPDEAEYQYAMAAARAAMTPSQPPAVETLTDERIAQAIEVEGIPVEDVEQAFALVRLGAALATQPPAGTALTDGRIKDLCHQYAMGEEYPATTYAFAREIEREVRAATERPAGTVSGIQRFTASEAPSQPESLLQRLRDRVAKDAA